jgi:hypothetical protein
MNIPGKFSRKCLLLTLFSQEVKVTIAFVLCRLSQWNLIQGEDSTCIKSWFRDHSLILPTKKDRKIFCILSKFSVFCKFQHNFQIGLLWKIQRKKLLKSCQLAAPKILCRKFFCFTGKICLYKIFYLFLLMVGLSPDWRHYYTSKLA